MADGALSSTYTAPADIGTAGSTSSGSLTQGAALPNITTTQQQATAAPSWYTDYLQNIAQQGAQAAQNAQFIGIQPMQQQAYNLAQSNVGNYQPTLNQATGALGSSINATSPLSAAQPYLSSAANPTYNTVNQYMNPYVNDVVSQIGNLAEQNVMNNVAPQTTAGLVGTGQFGSQRGAQALASNLGQYGQQTTALQANALNTGYQNAMTEAQAQAVLQGQLGQTAGSLASQGQQNLANAAQIGGQLATTTQNLGLGDVNALDTLGTQQQQILQAQQLFPLQMAQAEAGLLQGAQIPTSVSSTYTGPIPGAYQNSPLSQIATLGSTIGAISNTPFGQAIGNAVGSYFGSNTTPTFNSLDPYNTTTAGQTTADSMLNNPSTLFTNTSGLSPSNASYLTNNGFGSGLNLNNIPASPSYIGVGD